MCYKCMKKIWIKKQIVAMKQLNIFGKEEYITYHRNCIPEGVI